jgi:hypothetical protein
MQENDITETEQLTDANRVRLNDLLAGGVWGRSTREEILWLLKLIAGLLAYQNGINWLAGIMFVLSAFDFYLAMKFAIIEIALMKKYKRTPSS